MCECIDIKPQTKECYAQMAILSPPFRDKKICVDPCLKEEILFLWSKGVITTGCCCGHNILKPFINVDPSSETLMNQLTYTYWINIFGVKCYNPKTIKRFTDEKR